MQLHVDVFLRRYAIPAGIRCEFQRYTIIAQASGSSLSLFIAMRARLVSSRLNQNSQDVTKTDALSGALRGIAKRERAREMAPRPILP